MSHATQTPTVDALWPGFQCIRCGRRAMRDGSGRRFYAGFQQLVCARCKAEIDRRRTP
jgi:DNA-directed RNA polymerase subunit RPC12/RpoP